MVTTFLDTDILIDAAKMRSGALDMMEAWEQDGPLATTSVNVAEFLRGVPQAAAVEARKVLEGVPEVPFGPRAARRFGRLMHTHDRAGTPLGIADGMVASIVLEEGGRLATRNQAQFRRVDGLLLLP